MSRHKPEKRSSVEYFLTHSELVRLLQHSSASIDEKNIPKERTTLC